MALDDDIAVLSRQPLLGLMERDALRLLAFAAETRNLRAGDILFRAGDVGDGALLVLSGAVALTASEDGQPAKEIAGPGALIGELALFTGLRRPVTAIVREPTQVMKLSRAVMRRVLAEFPASAEQLAQAVAGRLRAFADELTSVQAALEAIDRR